MNVKIKMGLSVCVACLLVACHMPTPDTPEDRFYFILGSASQNPQKSEINLKKLLAEHQLNDDELGMARVNWALGELLKSAGYRQKLSTEQSIASYIQAAHYFEAARMQYMHLGKNALAASASVGAVNAYLLAEQMPQACIAYAQAKQLQQAFDAQQDIHIISNMNRNIAAFREILADC